MLFRSFNSEVNRYLLDILDPNKNCFMPRSLAETDPDFKQVIPYVVITDGHSVLHYVRGKKAGEQRLVAKGSIGIGGHVNQEDETLFAFGFGAQAFKDAVVREVKEEVSIQGEFEVKPVGLINDDSTEVGRVHFGVVHLLLCAPDKVKKNEQVITQVEFIPIEELRKKREQMETWSQLCLDQLPALLK